MQHHHQFNSSRDQQKNSPDNSSIDETSTTTTTSTLLTAALPFAFEFLTLQDLVNGARLTSRKWKETVEQQSYLASARHCAVILQRRLQQTNVQLAVAVMEGGEDDNHQTLSSGDSWKNATNESLEYIMRLFQSSSSSSSSSPLRKLLTTLRILRAIPTEAAIAYSRLYGRHVVPLIESSSSSSTTGTNSSTSSSSVQVQTFPHCTYHCPGCRLINHIPLKQQQQKEEEEDEEEEHSSMSSLLQNVDANSNQELLQQQQPPQQGPRLVLNGGEASNSNNNSDAGNQSSTSATSRRLGYQLDDFFVIYEKSISNNSNSNSEALKHAANVSTLTTDSPAVHKNETTEELVAANANATLNFQQERILQTRRGRRVLQLETYFPVCAPNLLPDMACPMCGLFNDDDIFSTRSVAAASEKRHTHQQEEASSSSSSSSSSSATRRPKIQQQQERTLFLSEISYPSVETCQLWTDTKLTFTPQFSTESAAPAKTATALGRSFPQSEQLDHDDRRRRGDSNYTSTTATTTQRRVRRRLSLDALDLLVPKRTTTSMSLHMASSRASAATDAHLESCTYPPDPYFDVAVPLTHQRRSQRPLRPPAPLNHVPPPRRRQTVAGGPYLHQDNVKNCLSIHCNKCQQFALLAPAVPCHSHSFACDGIRSLNAMQRERQQTRRRRRRARHMSDNSVDDDVSNDESDNDYQQDESDKVLDQAEVPGNEDDDDDDDDAAVVIGAVMVRRQCNGSATCQKATYCMACSEQRWHFPFENPQNNNARLPQPDDWIIHQSACNHCNLRLCREHSWLSSVCHHS